MEKVAEGLTAQPPLRDLTLEAGAAPVASTVQQVKRTKLPTAIALLAVVITAAAAEDPGEVELLI